MELNFKLGTAAFSKYYIQTTIYGSSSILRILLPTIKTIMGAQLLRNSKTSISQCRGNDAFSADWTAIGCYSITRAKVPTTVTTLNWQKYQQAASIFF